MKTTTIEEKQLLIKVMIAALDLKSSDIEEHLHVSRSVVSRHLRGEREYPAIDIFIIESFFGIDFKEYRVV